MMNEAHDTCDHCFHLFQGAIMMVIKPGHIIEQCCKCQTVRQVHPDHCDRGRKWVTTEAHEGWSDHGPKIPSRF